MFKLKYCMHHNLMFLKALLNQYISRLMRFVTKENAFSSIDLVNARLFMWGAIILADAGVIPIEDSLLLPFLPKLWVKAWKVLLFTFSRERKLDHDAIITAGGAGSTLYWVPCTRTNVWNLPSWWDEEKLKFLSWAAVFSAVVFTCCVQSTWTWFVPFFNHLMNYEMLDCRDI